MTSFIKQLDSGSPYATATKINMCMHFGEFSCWANLYCFFKQLNWCLGILRNNIAPAIDEFLWDAYEPVISMGSKCSTTLQWGCPNIPRSNFSGQMDRSMWWLPKLFMTDWVFIFTDRCKWLLKTTNNWRVW